MNYLRFLGILFLILVAWSKWGNRFNSQSTFGLSPNLAGPDLDSDSSLTRRADSAESTKRTAPSRTVRLAFNGSDLVAVRAVRTRLLIWTVQILSDRPKLSDRTQWDLVQPNRLRRTPSLAVAASGPHRASAFFHLGQKQSATRTARPATSVRAPLTPSPTALRDQSPSCAM